MRGQCLPFLVRGRDNLALVRLGLVQDEVQSDEHAGHGQDSKQDDPKADDGSHGNRMFHIEETVKGSVR